MALVPFKRKVQIEKPRDQYCVYVDARMITKTGIGRHIFEHLRGLNRLGAALAVSHFDEAGLKKVIAACPTAQTFHTEAKIYGFRERFGSSLGIGRFSEKADVYWFPQYNVPWILPYPSVVTVHDLIQFRYNRASYGGWPKVVVADAVLKNALKQAARIVCVSHATKQDLVEMDASFAKRIRVVENGVGEKWSRSSVSGHVAVKEIVGDKPYLLSVSTRKPHKNQLLLLRLMDEISSTHEHHLVLAGPKTPEWEKTYREWLSETKVGQRVHDLDEVDEDTLVGLYRNASLFLLPSLYEGFGLTVLEAMVAGCPTIVSNRGALPEVVGNAGKVLDPLDLDQWIQAVGELLTDSDKAKHFVELGKVRAAQFSWKRQSERLLEVFEEVL